MSEPTIVSWSEISTARQCPHKHQLAYVERWTKPTSSPALMKGIAWHEVMEGHYLGEADPLARIAEADEDVRTLVAWMYEGYLELYRADPFQADLEVEEPFLVPLDRDEQYWLKGRVDLRVSLAGRPWLVDHKSGANMPDDKELALDDQFGLYAWAMRELGRPVFGLCWNAATTRRNKVKTQDLKDRYRRVLLHRSDTELDAVHADALATVRWVYESQPTWRSPDTQTCKWKCDYTLPCLLGRQQGDAKEREALTDLGFEINLTRH